MNPPSSEIQPNLPPEITEAPSELETPPPVEVPQTTETPVISTEPAAPPVPVEVRPPVETPVVSGKEIDLGAVIATPTETDKKPDPATVKQLEQTLKEEPIGLEEIELFDSAVNSQRT